MKIIDLPNEIIEKVIDELEINHRISFYLSKKEYYYKFWKENKIEKNKFINEDFRCVNCGYNGSKKMFIFLCHCMFRKPIMHDECYDISKQDSRYHKNGYDYMQCPNCNKMVITIYIPFFV